MSEEDTEVPDRLTAVLKFYHQSEDDEIKGTELSFSRNLITREQLYSRNLKISMEEGWKEIDFGWLVGNVGTVCVVNTEGNKLQRIPTDEQKADIDKRVLQVCLGCTDGVGVWQVRPYGEFCFGSPSGHLFIRCLHGTAHYTLTVIPE